MVVVVGRELAKLQPLVRKHRVIEHGAHRPHAPLLDRGLLGQRDHDSEHHPVGPDRHHATHSRARYRLLLRRQSVIQSGQRKIKQDTDEAHRAS